MAASIKTTINTITATSATPISSLTVLYSGGTRGSEVRSIQVCNTSSTTAYFVWVYVTDGTTAKGIALNYPVPIGSSVSLLDGQIMLQTGFSIRAYASTTGVLDTVTTGVDFS